MNTKPRRYSNANMQALRQNSEATKLSNCTSDKMLLKPMSEDDLQTFWRPY
jgi:hypothetical protein